MATVKPIKSKKAVDYVGYEPVMLAVSKARAMAWVLEQLHANNNLEHALQDAPEETADWLHSVVADALGAAPRRHRARVPKARHQPAAEGSRSGGSRAPAAAGPHAEGRCVMATKTPMLPWYRTVGSLEDQAAALQFEALLVGLRGVYVRLSGSQRAALSTYLRILLDGLEGRHVQTVTPEDTLRDGGISTERQACYQRRMSSLLAGRV